MSKTNSSIVWCDIPAKDLNRATKFYSAVIGKPVEKQSYGDFEISILPHDDATVGGCIFAGPDATPGAAGPLIYLNCEGRLDEAVAAVEPNGGKILEPSHPIGPHGFRAVVLDSEGNRIALHSH